MCLASAIWAIEYGEFSAPAQMRRLLGLFGVMGYVVLFHLFRTMRPKSFVLIVASQDIRAVLPMQGGRHGHQQEPGVGKEREPQSRRANPLVLARVL